MQYVCPSHVPWALETSDSNWKQDLACMEFVIVMKAPVVPNCGFAAVRRNTVMLKKCSICLLWGVSYSDFQLVEITPHAITENQFWQDVSPISRIFQMTWEPVSSASLAYFIQQISSFLHWLICQFLYLVNCCLLFQILTCCLFVHFLRLIYLII